MILYFHGFGSCSESTKPRLLKARFGAENVVSPDIPVEPDKAVEYIGELIRKFRPSLLIGSSLGGYYATFFAEYHGLQAALINPSTRPYETLAAYVGTNHHWCSGEPFEWKAAYVKQLRCYDRDIHRGKYLVLLQTGDEDLDYRLAEKKHAAHDVVIEEGGNHRFENLHDYLDRIDAFYRMK